MTIDEAYVKALEPLVRRVELAAERVEDAAKFAAAIDSSGLPPDRATLTVAELAGLTTLRKDTIRELFQGGVLKGVQTGNRILVWRWSVIEYMGLGD